MTRSNWYPEPPHLTISLYPESTESECFASVCDVVGRAGCVPSGAVEVVPWDITFELRSELAGRSSVMDLSSGQFQHFVSGGDPAWRPVRVNYRIARRGTVLVEYLAATYSDRHPIGVSLAAGELGIPMESWNRRDRNAASKLARWATEVLKEVAVHCRVAYGAIGVEYSLATPSELADDTAALPTEVFLSKRIATDCPHIWDAFVHHFRDGSITEWPTGWFLSGWAPFNPNSVSLPLERRRPVNPGRQLGRFLLSC